MLHRTQIPGIIVRSRRFRIILPFLFLCAPLSAVAPQTVCDRIVIQDSPDISFSRSELSLMCSNPDVEGWGNVTDTQALFYLKNFLSVHGYHDIRAERKGNQLIVTLGEPSRVTKFEVENVPPEFKPQRMRRVLGEKLTPQLLNQVEDRIFQRLQSTGYACPVIKTQAETQTGLLKVQLTPGKKGRVTTIRGDEIHDLDQRALRRYDAFQLGEYFNGNWLRVTENRIQIDGVVQSSHFSPECNEDEVTLRQKNVAGLSRLFSFGVGVNTERGPSLRASWRNGRFWEMGSNVEVAASASFRLQELVFKPKWYLLPVPSRFYLSPYLSFKREDEKFFERYSATFGVTPGYTWDAQNWGMVFTVGPALNLISVAIPPAGAKRSEFLSLNAAIRIENHEHEFYRSSPQSGFQIDLVGSFTERNAFSNVTARMVRFDFDYLYNLLDFEPAFLVFGLRGSLATTFVDNADISRVPQNFKFYYGGTQNLRGFPRNQLPNPDGALTGGFLSAEFRFPDLLPWGLQPLGLFDIGATGPRTLMLDPTYFYSPGLGLRWQSPIGVVRSTLARGFVTDGKPDVRTGWQLYFSYGEEF